MRCPFTGNNTHRNFYSIDNRNFRPLLICGKSPSSLDYARKSAWTLHSSRRMRRPLRLEHAQVARLESLQARVNESGCLGKAGSRHCWVVVRTDCYFLNDCFEH